MAAPDEDYNSGDIGYPGLPDLRLVGAVFSPRYAVVIYDLGGFAPVRQLLVIGPGVDGLHVLWEGNSPYSIEDSASLRRAVKTGSLWTLFQR